MSQVAANNTSNPKLARFRQLMAEKKLSNHSLSEVESIQLPGNKHLSKESTKENTHPNNYTAMKTIMTERGNMTKKNETNLLANELSNSMDASDASPFAMLGNYLDESRLSQLGLGSIVSSLRSNDGVGDESISITPAKLNGGNAHDAALGDWDASGILSFLGGSPLYGEQQTKNVIQKNGDPVKNSAEKVKQLEQKLLRSAHRISSPEKIPINQNKEVKFAIQGGWQTPRGDTLSKYPKSPFIGEQEPSMTDDSSMEPQVNPMNESVLISDDEASVESKEASDDSTSISEDSRGRSSKGKVYQSSTATSPSKASLMERNKTLVKEVRFADQTCVELSAKNKYYKEQYGKVKKDLLAANKDKSLLKENYETSLQENTRLKVLVESLQAQKDQATSQVEAYRNQIVSSEKSHRSDLKRWEDLHHSHLKNSQKQLSTLNERLEQSLIANKSLQGKVDAIEGRLESKQRQESSSSDELINSLKELVASGDNATDKATASIQEASQLRINELQKLCDEQRDQLKQARTECEMIGYDRDYWQSQCDGLHRQITDWNQSSDSLLDVFFNEDGSQNEDFINKATFTPTKEKGLGSDALVENPITPTSNLLARTLQSELKRRHTTSDKLEQAERKVTALQHEIDEMKMDMEECRADKALLEEELEEKCVAIAEFDELLEYKDAKIDELETKLEQQNVQIDNLLDEIDVMCNEENSEDEAKLASPSKEMRRTIVSLEERLEATEGTLEYTDGELVKTRDELQRTTNELALTKEQLNEFDESMEKLNKELTDAYVEIADQKRFSDFQASTIERINHELAQSSKANEKLRKQLTSFFRSLQALDKILHNYEESDDAVRQKMTEFSIKIAELTAKVNGISIDLVLEDNHERNEANEKLQQALGYLEELTNQVKDQCNESETLRSQVNAMTAELNFYKLGSTKSSAPQLAALRVNNSDLINENEHLRVNLKSYELQLENQKALLRSATQEAEGFRDNAKASKSAFECLQAEATLTKQSLSKLEEECKILRQEISKQENELKQSKRSMSEAHERLLKEKTVLQERFQSLDTNCKNLEMKLVSELQERGSVEARLENALKDKASLEEELGINLEECDEKQRECQALIVQLQQIQSALADAEDESSEQQEVIDRLERQIKEQNDSLLSCEESIIGYKDDIRRLKNELHHTLTEKNSRIEMLEKGLSDRQMLFTEQLSRTKKERDESNADLTEMIDKLKVELQTTNSSHKEFADKMKVETRKFEGKIREQEEDIHNLQKQLYQSEQQLEGTLRQLNTMEIDYSRLATKNDDDSEDVSQLRHQIYEMHANLEELKEAGGQQSQEIAELTEDNNRLAHKCHTFKNAIKELNNKVKSWEKSYRDQSDLLLTYSREISRLNGGRSY
ncbi:hypothetical protein ACHAXM_000776 [Skeletonema potamos]